MQNGHRRREKSCVLAQLGQFFDGGILARAIGGDGHGLAALHGQTHYGKDLLHVGDFAVLSHSDFALKAFGSFAQDTGGTGVQTFSERQPEQLPVRLEAGTLNGHGIAGLDAALDFIAVTGMETIRAHETALMRRFYEGVRDIPGVTVYGDFTHARTAVVALNIADLDSGEVADALAEDSGLATRSGAHCAPRLHRALGTEGQGAVRFSFGWYNTEEETDAAIRAVEELAR